MIAILFSLLVISKCPILFHEFLEERQVLIFISKDEIFFAVNFLQRPEENYL